MANTGNTAETICSAPAREKEESLFICVSLHTLESYRRTLKGVKSKEWKCVAKAAVAFLSDSSAWALEFVIFLAAPIWTYMGWCQSIPLSIWAAEAEGVCTEASYCGLWQAKAILSSPYHGTHCSFCCQQPQSGLLTVLGLHFEEQPQHLLLNFMQRWCRRMEDLVSPCPDCLSLYPQRP